MLIHLNGEKSRGCEKEIWAIHFVLCRVQSGETTTKNKLIHTVAKPICCLIWFFINEIFVTPDFCHDIFWRSQLQNQQAKKKLRKKPPSKYWISLQNSHHAEITSNGLVFTPISVNTLKNWSDIQYGWQIKISSGLSSGNAAKVSAFSKMVEGSWEGSGEGSCHGNTLVWCSISKK